MRVPFVHKITTTLKEVVAKNMKGNHSKDGNDEDILSIAAATNNEIESYSSDANSAASVASASAASATSAARTDTEMNLTEDSVYEYYTETLFPALMSSFPILLERIMHDSKDGLAHLFCRIVGFLLPAIPCCSDGNGNGMDNIGLLAGASSTMSSIKQVAALRQLWEQTVMSKSSSNSTTIAEFLLGQFDTNKDGHISPKELLDLGEIMKRWDTMIQHQHHISWWAWFSREWPLMDWKIGVFIWKTFGGLLLLIALLSIIPGRLHSLSGRILRWPVLALTYFLVAVELGVYVMIRLFIRLAETIFAKPKHRKLRRSMAEAEDFKTWYRYAKKLDKSKKRDTWQSQIQDETSSRYNWSFIRELMLDMREARETNNSFLAMAVLQQCTRKNVGGIMSEDLFSYTYTGEPKYIVREFVKEVEMTLKWVTDEALKVPIPNNNTNTNNDHDRDREQQNNDMNEPDHDQDEKAAKQSYEKQLERQVKNEKDKIWGSLMSWATLSFAHPIDVKDLKREKTQQSTRSKRQQQLNQSDLKEKQKQIDDNMNGSNTNSIKSKDSPRQHKANGIQRDGKEKVTCNSGYSDSDTNTVTTHGSELSSTSAGNAFPGSQLPPIHREQVLKLLKRARAAYGRTALCLSGGAMMGMYHFGHVVGLLECGILPHIISGTSAGSAIGAAICTRTDEELKRDLRPEVLATKLLCFSRPWPDRIKSLWQNGCLFDFNEWHEMIKYFTFGDMTFEEAYKKTGRVLCITLSATTKKAPPVLLNYLSAPNVTIASAIIASAAVPGCLNPVSLRYKDADGNICTQGDNKDQTYFDGSIDSDIPINGLAEMLNCQFYIACQCNPHVVPFFFDAKGGVGRPSRWSSDRHEHTWRGGFLLAALEMYLKNDMKAKMVFLNDIEAAVGFTSTLLTQQFHGSTTIVPQVSLWDYFRLFSNPSPKFVEQSFQIGSVAAYQHCAMIKLHYSIADALEECIAKLECKHPPMKRSGINVKDKKKHNQLEHHPLSIIRSLSHSNTNHSNDDCDAKENEFNNSPTATTTKKQKRSSSIKESSSQSISDNEYLCSSDSERWSAGSDRGSSPVTGRRRKTALSNDSTLATTTSATRSFINEGNYWIDEDTMPKY